MSKPTATDNQNRPKKKASDGRERGSTEQHPQPDELEFLVDLGRAISSFSDRDELLRFTLDTALALLGSESGSLYLYDPETEELVLTIARGPDREQRLGLRQRLGEGVAGQVALERKPILVTDIGTDARFNRKRSKRYKTSSFICAPLLVSNELIGIITVTMKRGRETFTGDELKILSILAGHAASAIESLRLYQELRAFNRELEERVRQATEQLSAANERLATLQAFNESILESIPLGVVAFDRQMRITYRNRRMGEMLPLEVGQPLAELFQGLKVDERRCPWRERLPETLREGKVVQFPRVGCAEGRMVDFVASPLRDAAGRIAGGLLVVEDTTRKVAMERQLATTERMASVGQLAARVAHELNNPLDGIMRYINLALRVQPPDSPAIEYLQHSRTGVMRMVAIIRDLLIYSRSTFGALEATEINRLVEEAAKSLSSKAAAQGVTIHTDFAEGLPLVRAGNLFQVFYNLIANAIDAMPTGGHLYLRTSSRDGYTEVSVRDTGTGIPPEIQDKIFEPFFTTKEPGKGTGLGLAICRDIVEKYEGTLHFNTEPGRGTEFIVRIPMET